MQYFSTKHRQNTNKYVPQERRKKPTVIIANFTMLNQNCTVLKNKNKVEMA